MEAGTVSDPMFPGQIDPDEGEGPVEYGDTVVTGTAPDRDDRVRFTRDPENPLRATFVERIVGGAAGAVIAPAAGHVPHRKRHASHKPRSARKPKAKEPHAAKEP